jgi:hypothetical protein
VAHPFGATLRNGRLKVTPPRCAGPHTMGRNEVIGEQHLWRGSSGGGAGRVGCGLPVVGKASSGVYHFSEPAFPRQTSCVLPRA